MRHICNVGICSERSRELPFRRHLCFWSLGPRRLQQSEHGPAGPVGEPQPSVHPSRGRKCHAERVLLDVCCFVGAVAEFSGFLAVLRESPQNLRVVFEQWPEAPQICVNAARNTQKNSSTNRRDVFPSQGYAPSPTYRDRGRSTLADPKLGVWNRREARAYSTHFAHV